MNFNAILATILAQVAQSQPATQSQPAHIGVPENPLQPISSQVGLLLGPTFSKTTFTGWLVLLGGIFFGLVAGRVVQTFLRNIAERLKSRGWIVRAAVFQHAAGPANLGLFALGLGLGLQGPYVESPQVSTFLLKLVAFLYILAIGWFLYNVVELVDLALRKLTAKSATKIDDTVATLLRKALRIFVAIMFVLFVAQNFFNANITAWLAGLGIAGLAVSLAAQDSIKNVFGSITVLISRPFGLGDRIIFGAYDGVVESISFRDTKIRTLDGHLITVPNMKFTDQVVENTSARLFLPRTMNIGLAHDTPPEKMQEAVQLIKDILADPAIAESLNVPDRPPRVYFTDFHANGLNIQISYAYETGTPGRDRFTFQEHAERFNLRLMRTLSDAGIEFAFPSSKVYVAGDSKRQLAVQIQKGSTDEHG